MAHTKIKNLLFDLGGVLYEIDIDKTVNTYNEMREEGAPSVDFSKKGQNEWFTKLDCGEIEIDEFAAGLKETYQLTGTLEEIKQIWMDLLIGVLPGRIEAFEKLSGHYQMGLLSNTSRYHRDHYAPQCEAMFSRMQHLCYSFDMGVKKPGDAIYLQALKTLGWKAEETLFLDDSKINIDAAEKLGFQTAWIENHDDFHTAIEPLLLEITRNELTTLFQKAKWRPLLKKLKAIAPTQSDALQNEIDMAVSLHSSIKKRLLSGTISSDDQFVEENKLGGMVSAIIDRLGEKEAEPEAPKGDLPDLIKVLFLAANPEDTGQLRLGEELREVRESIQLSEHRDRIELDSRFAVRPRDLSRAMVGFQPTIVHFSGHGVELDSPDSAPGSRGLDLSKFRNKELSGGIALENEDGSTKVVSADALASLFQLFEGTIQCVMLNACHSKLQADAIIKYVPYVVGMNTAVPDKTAITFASAFYDALGAGEDIPFAFQLAKANIALEGLHGADIPELIRRDEQAES